MFYPRTSFLIAALGFCAAATSRAGAQPAVLRVASTASDSYAEALYAQDQGFFRRAGLDVELSILASGAAITTAVAAGAIDVGITNVLPLAAAVEHGIPFLYFCSGGTLNPNEIGLCVAADAPIRTAKDLNGKTVASSSLNDINIVAVRAWMDQHGGDSSTVRVVEMPFSEMAAAVRRGTVDAAPIAEPALTAAKQAGGVRVLLPPFFEVFGAHCMIGGWFATAAWLQANRETARRFAGTIYATARWANAHPGESAAILAKAAKLDPSAVRGMNRAPYGLTLTPGMIQSILDLSYQYKAIARPAKAADLIAAL